MDCAYQKHASGVCSRVLREDEWDKDLLFPCLRDGAPSMKAKLLAYAAIQLPGGKYWKPEPQVELVLRQLHLKNDLWESILGLNDYLVTALPNMDQQTRSNLVQIKKNGTINWLESLPPEQQELVTRLAVTNRSAVHQEYVEEQKRVAEQRQQNMMQAELKRDQQEKREAAEQQKLSKVHLVTSVAEFDVVLSDINDEQISSARKRAKILSLLEEQVKVRKKLLNQKCNIKFSQNCKQRPLTELTKEVRDLILKDSGDYTAESIKINNPMSLVGRQILHRFTVNEGQEDEWYNGYVIAYNSAKQLHEVAYDNEVDHCHFNLMEDLEAGDLKVCPWLE